MSGARIKMAKQALLYALKSLPPNSFFNIYSFGSGYSRLYEQSQASNEKNVTGAIKKVESFDADMGGTEIYDPFFVIFKEKRLKKHPRTLFLLTDGNVSSPDKVINLVRANNHRARVFSLGIGNGCSQHLVMESAKAGRGCSEFVGDPSGISGKVVSLMEAAFTPVCDDFSLEFSNKKIVKMVAPDPVSMNYLLRNQKATFYILLHSAAADEAAEHSNKGGLISFVTGFLKSKSALTPDEFGVTFKCFDTGKGTYSSSSLKINLKEYEQELDIVKLAVGEMTDILERKDKGVAVDILDVFYAFKKDINEEIISLSVENQVLTRRTAFICVAEESNPDAIQTLTKEKVIIPQLLSKDYTEQIQPIDMNYQPESQSSPSLHSHHTLKLKMMSAQPQDFIARNKKSTLSSLERKASPPKAQISSLKMMNDAGVDSMKRQVDEIIDRGCVLENLSQQSATLDTLSNSRQYKSKSSNFFSSMSLGGKPKSLNFSSSKSTDSTSIQKESTSTLDTTEQAFLEVIQSQKSLGYWEPSSQYYIILGIDKSNLIKKMPSAVSSAKDSIERIAITIALLKWIETYFSSKQSSWNLIHKKGVQWLKTVGLKYSEIAPKVDLC